MPLVQMDSEATHSGRFHIGMHMHRGQQAHQTIAMPVLGACHNRHCVPNVQAEQESYAAAHGSFTCSQPLTRGMSVDGSTAWAASSMMTQSNLDVAPVSTLLPANESVLNTI